jgi:hypothetical protein
MFRECKSRVLGNRHILKHGRSFSCSVRRAVDPTLLEIVPLRQQLAPRLASLATTVEAKTSESARGSRFVCLLCVPTRLPQKPLSYTFPASPVTARLVPLHPMELVEEHLVLRHATAARSP